MSVQGHLVYTSFLPYCDIHNDKKYFEMVHNEANWKEYKNMLHLKNYIMKN